jgi:hypothetical protein
LPRVKGNVLIYRLKIQRIFTVFKLMIRIANLLMMKNPRIDMDFMIILTIVKHKNLFQQNHSNECQLPCEHTVLLRHGKYWFLSLLCGKCNNNCPFLYRFKQIICRFKPLISRLSHLSADFSHLPSDLSHLSVDF